MSKAYDDVSIFQGFREFCDEAGQWWRAEHTGSGYWRLYRHDNYGGAYICDGLTGPITGRNPRCRTIMRSYLERAA